MTGAATTLSCRRCAQTVLQEIQVLWVGLGVKKPGGTVAVREDCSCNSSFTVGRARDASATRSCKPVHAHQAPTVTSTMLQSKSFFVCRFGNTAHLFVAPHFPNALRSAWQSDCAEGGVPLGLSDVIGLICSSGDMHQGTRNVWVDVRGSCPAFLGVSHGNRDTSRI
jgi:hypothetical protein